jgi:hypothetical protein
MLRLYVPNDYTLKIKGEIIFRVFLSSFPKWDHIFRVFLTVNDTCGEVYINLFSPHIIIDS